MKQETKSTVLLIYAVLFTILQGIGIILYRLAGYEDLAWTVESIMIMIVAYGMYESYRSHTKNVTKPLIGGILFLLLDRAAYWGVYYIQYGQDWFSRTNLGVILYGAAQIVIFVLVLLININHYSINATHHSSPKQVKFNGILFYLYLAACAVQCLSAVLMPESALYQASMVFCTVSDVFLMSIVIRIERNSDEFRLNREAAGNEVFDVKEDAPKGKGIHLLVNAIVFTVAEAIAYITYVLDNNYQDFSWLINILCLVVVCFGIYSSYRKHIKNITKPLVGAALLLMVYYEMNWALYYVQFFDELGTWYENSNAMVAYAICEIVMLVAISLVAILYFSINSTHDSSPKKVRWSHYFSFIFVLAALGQAASNLFFADSVLGTISYMAEPIAMIFLMSLVLAIEGYAEQGRLNRENANSNK